MNRTLTSLLTAAAVVGATSGTLVARTVADRDGARDDRPAATSTGDARAGEVLWANRVGIHDGDLTVPVRLPGYPVELQRAASGWVVSTVADPYAVDLRSRRTAVVTPEGEVRPLAETAGGGDVSPDGTRYVAQAEDGSGYAVWDLASRERVASVVAGETPAREGGAGAQFVDGDTVATTWEGAGAQEVVLSDLGSTERTVVADDVFGSWVISPDGRWFAGTQPRREGGQDEPGCLVVRPVDGSSTGRTDCSSFFAGPPAFAADGSAVLTVPGYQLVDAELEKKIVLRELPTDPTMTPRRLPTPLGNNAAVLLDPGEAVTLGSGVGLEPTTVAPGFGGFGDPGSTAEPEPEPEPEEQTVVEVCVAGGDCAEVARVDGDAYGATLGLPY